MTGSSAPAERRRRRGDGLVVIYWRDIPAQVNVRSGRDRAQRILPRRFQKAIDHAATVAGLTTASEYVSQWRRLHTATHVDDPLPTAVDEAARLEAEFPLARLDRFVAAGGWDPDRPSGTDDHSDLSEETCP
ncbi:MAG: virulence factor, partial [Acidimicrobiales bacterium]